MRMQEQGPYLAGHYPTSAHTHSILSIFWANIERVTHVAMNGQIQTLSSFGEKIKNCGHTVMTTADAMTCPIHRSN